MKRKSYRLIFQRGIKKTKSRFISIFLIVFIGSAFFAGLRSTPISMQQSLSDTIRQHHLADLSIFSTIGFLQEDIDTVQQISGVKQVSGVYRFDASMMYESHYYSVIAHSADDYFHTSDIIEGRNIQKDGEILLDNSLKSKQLLGKNIKLQTSEFEKEFEVVGIVNDSRYITQLMRGSNSFTNINNDAFVILSKEDAKEFVLSSNQFVSNQDSNLVNEMIVEYDMPTTLNIFSTQYQDQSNKIKEVIEQQLQNQLEDRYFRLREDYIQKASQVQDNQNQLDIESFSRDSTAKISKIQLELDKLQKNLVENQNSLDQDTTNIRSRIDQINHTIEEYRQKIQYLESSSQLNTNNSVSNLNHIDVQTFLSRLDYLELTLTKMQQLTSQESSLELMNNELDQLEQQLQNNKTLLESKINQTNQILDDTSSMLDKTKSKIEHYQQNIELLPKVKLFSFTINQNEGIMSYQSDTNAMLALSNVFPLIFFLVAALVSLTTMTRMVEEQRTQCGVLRALGYSKKDVYMLYIRYILLATLCAGITGIIFGTQFFTRIIYYLYTTLMYNVNAPIHIVVSNITIFSTLVICVGINLIATLFVIFNELNNKTASLLRPKPPKCGQRTVLERMSFIWKHLSFHNKITIRNMIRYKKRFLMSLIGIAGCSALILTGFGLKTSIQEIIPRQFNKVWTYDGSISIHDDLSEDQMQQLTNQLKQENDVNELDFIQNQYAIASSTKYQDLYLNLKIMDNTSSNMIHFYDNNGKQKSLDDNGIIITQKAAEMLKVSQGDHINLTIQDKTYDMKIEMICENYYYHYIYMSSSYYQQLTNDVPKYNEIIFNLKPNSTINISTLENDLNQYDQINGVTLTSTLISNFDQMMNSINIVVILITIFAALLDFIVIYNLTNINIQERKNEIATIKVLGFYDKEVYQYVFKENIYLTVIGSLIGLLLGTWLHYFIVSTVEVDITMFYRKLELIDYILAFILTFVFSKLINIWMKRSLSKIDMVESLKGVE